jgi:hypothetical protein
LGQTDLRADELSPAACEELTQYGGVVLHGCTSVVLVSLRGNQ